MRTRLRHHPRWRTPVVRTVECVGILVLYFGPRAGLGEGVVLAFGIVFTVAVLVDLAT